MALKDLSGKTVYELEQEDFETLFCRRCKDYPQCPRDELKMKGCQLLVDSGLYDTCLQKRS